VLEPIKEIFAVTSPIDTLLRSQLVLWCANTAETIAFVVVCPESRNLLIEHEPVAWHLQKLNQKTRQREAALEATVSKSSSVS
jgi:hypothetical protein